MNTIYSFIVSALNLRLHYLILTLLSAIKDGHVLHMVERPPDVAPAPAQPRSGMCNVTLIASYGYKFHRARARDCTATPCTTSSFSATTVAKHCFRNHYNSF